MTDKKDIIIDQCLFGYNDGHRLISSSVLFDENVHNELLRKSDSSAGIGSSVDDFYYTGFPLIKFKSYALIKTWPAPEMNRPGCVWSQVLLIKFSDFDKIQDLSSLDRLFSRPNKNHSSYEIKLKISEPQGFNLNVTHEKNKFFKVVRAIHSSSERNKIIYTSQPKNYIFSIYKIWSLQWPKLRRSLCFTVSSFDAILNDDLLKKNDILFIRDEWHTKEVEKYDDWQYKLIDLISNHHEKLKNYLWGLGRFINGGRLKLPVMIELFYLINEKNKGEQASYDYYFDAFEMLSRIVRSPSELQFGIDLITELLVKSIVNQQQLVYYCIAILERFNHDEINIPKNIRDRLISVIRNSNSSVNFDFLLKEEFILTKGLIVTEIIKKSQINNIPFNKYSLRSFSYICESNHDAIFSEYFSTLPLHFKIYIIRKNWGKLSESEKVSFIKGLCHNNNDDTVLLFNAFRNLELLRSIILGRIFLDNAIHFIIKDKIIVFIIQNLSISQSLARSYNLLSVILNDHGFNDYVVNLIPAHEVGKSMTHHLNELPSNEMFNFYSFSYSKLYSSSNDEMTHVLIYSFMQLHELLSRDIFTFKGWEMLFTVLPDVSIFKSWDKCYILRRSLQKYCKKNKISSNVINRYLSGNRSLTTLIQRDEEDDLK